ncbi:MAG TPA: Ig-like domain-containing protein, partial [Gammaproteobacteria bacterium]|nr:Ig-like domain-containing protein [Gammaproteobacteria bacterium]
MTIDGSITADGIKGATHEPYWSYSITSGGGGGSGGAIWINASTLAGSGTIRANGGDGGKYAGGGGAGRIALDIGVDNGSVAWEAQGGESGGGAGTVFHRIEGQSATLFLEASDSGGYSNLDLNGASYDFPDVVSRGEWHITLGSGTTLSASSLEVAQGELSFNVPSDISQLPQLGSLEVKPDAKLTHDHSSAQKYGVRLKVSGNARIDGPIDVTEKGYPGGETGQPGSGPGGGAGNSSDSAQGGGYGGAGGEGWNSGTSGGASYGDRQGPSDYGSGGGGGGNSWGGDGGGAVRLIVGGTLTIDSAIDASGGWGGRSYSASAGGGAGGSIWLDAQQLEGSGKIRANGGDGGDFESPNGGGGGAGGRIAIFFQTENSSWSVLEAMGGRGYETGGDGTIEKEKSDVTPPEITSVKFDDRDGSGGLSIGDIFRFTFSERMVASAIRDQTQEADTHLSPEGKSYGTLNELYWNEEKSNLTIEITEGFTLTGNETVSPSDRLTDIDQNPVGNTAQLSLSDSIPPEPGVSINAEKPVSPDQDLTVSLYFRGAVDRTVEPAVQLRSKGGQTVTAPSGGEWGGTEIIGETVYTTAPIPLDQNWENPISVDVSGAKDTNGNTMAELRGAVEFNIRGPAPSIANFSLAPEVTSLSTNQVTLKGDRPANTSVWIDRNKAVPQGSGPWAAGIDLGNGNNTVRIFAQDAEGVPSEEIRLKFFVDKNAPEVAGVIPASGSFISALPTIQVSYNETGSGIDISGSQLEVTRGGVGVPGNWTDNGGTLLFQPESDLSDDHYEITAQLQDKAGLTSGTQTTNFTLDRVPPAAPKLSDLPEVTNDPRIKLSGTKDPFAAIRLNGDRVVANTEVTTWSSGQDMVEGENTLQLVAADRAGNTSEPVSVTVTFDNTAPGPVTVSAGALPSGTGVELDWTGYDEAANGGDIAHYNVYRATSAYTDTAQATRVA